MIWIIFDYIVVNGGLIDCTERGLGMEVTTSSVNTDPVKCLTSKENDTFLNMLNELRDAKIVGSSGILQEEHTLAKELGGSYMPMFEENKENYILVC